MWQDKSDDDVRKTLEVSTDIASTDPDFTYRVLAGSQSKIKNLMWTNCSSRMQYKFFGDVVTFDTT